MRLIALGLLLLTGCFASHDLESDEERSRFEGIWVFPTLYCDADHTVVYELCSDGRATQMPGFVRDGLNAERRTVSGRWTRDGRSAVFQPMGDDPAAVRFDLMGDTLVMDDLRTGCVAVEGLREADFARTYPDLAEWYERDGYGPYLPGCR